MPLGPCNETQTMSKLTDRVIVYLVDLLLVSATFERYLEILKEEACHIKRAGLTIIIGKSTFCGKTVKYLVHIVGNGLPMDPEKISATTAFPIPKSHKAFRSFLGLWVVQKIYWQIGCNYFSINELAHVQAEV